MISIKGLNKAEVLAALFNAARPQGLGFKAYDSKPMTKEIAEKVLIANPSLKFDYLQGRVIKMNLSGDDVETFGYNRDNGQDAAEKVIQVLKDSGDTNAQAIKEIHHTGTRKAIDDTEEMLKQDSHLDGNTYHLGLSEFKKELEPIIGKIKSDN